MERYSTDELIHLLGASKSDLANYLGLARNSLYDVLYAKLRLPDKCKAAMSLVQTTTKRAHTRVTKQRKSTASAPEEEVRRLQAIYYRQEAMLIRLREQLTTMRTFYAQATLALAIMDNMEIPTTSSAEVVKLKRFLRRCRTRMALRSRRNGFAAQLDLEMRITAAEAKQKLATDLLEKRGSELIMGNKKEAKGKKFTQK